MCFKKYVMEIFGFGFWEDHFADDFFKNVLLNKQVCILIQISLKYIFIVRLTSLFQVKAYCQIVATPLHEPMMTQFTAAYMNGQKWFVLSCQDVIWMCLMSIVNHFL